MSDSIAIGYDPVFLDVLVKIKDEDGNLLKKVPYQAGSHYPFSEISLEPGGNGLNLAKTLSRLRHDPVTFVGKVNTVMRALLSPYENLQVVSVKDQEPNITVSLELEQGEFQINYKHVGFAPDDLTPQAITLFQESRVNTYSNLGLNPSALELYDFLASKILDSGRLLEGKISVFDPSTLLAFDQWEVLREFFEEKFSRLPGVKIVSVNEEEYQLLRGNGALKESKGFMIVVHSTSQVVVHDGEKTRFLVPPLPGPAKQLLGAGDAFNAGLVQGFLTGCSVVESVRRAIETAQQHILGRL